MRRLLPLVVVLVGGLAVAAAEPNWPAFRGGAQGSVAKDKALPDTWAADKNIAWQIDLPGRGWSSPIVWGDRIFVTTVETDAKLPDQKKGLYINDLTGKPQEGEHHWMVYCLDWKSGQTLWKKEAFKAEPASPIHIKNTYASETPVTDGERVYACFGNVGLVCYDLQGKEIWSKKLTPRKTRMGWGPAASPALDGDRLYLVNDNEEQSYLTALDKKTGEEVWKVERDEKSNWATPFIWKNDQRTEIITAGSKRVRSYDTDGKVLWELSGMSIVSIPTPLAGPDLLYVSSGYILDPTIKPVYAIRPGASGDISLKEGETSNKWIAWSQKQAGPYNPSPLLYGDYFYVLYDRGLLSCFEAKTGKMVYEKERLGAPQVTASPWAADGKIYCLSEDGDTIVVQAGKEFKILGKNSLDDMALATPAVLRGSIVLRTQSKLYRIGK
jgi:outer membrane protein assembly factor BamB